jgi:hypothetical protein
MKYAVGASNYTENFSFNGNCKYCVTITDYECEGSYSASDGAQDKDRWKVLIVFQESSVFDLTYNAADAWKIQAYMKDNARQKYTGSTGPINCWDCDTGPPASSQSLENLAAWSVDQGPWQWEDWTSWTFWDVGTIDKRWFRTTWNTVMTDDPINPDTETSIIEPSGDLFVCWEQDFGEQITDYSHSQSGWCHVFGCTDSACCALGAGCYRSPGGGSWSDIGPLHPIAAPSFTFPIKILRNGGTFEVYPDGGGQNYITYYDADNYP